MDKFKYKTKISGDGKIVQRTGRMKGSELSEIIEKITTNISDYY